MRLTWLLSVLALLVSVQARADSLQVTFQTSAPAPVQYGHSCFYRPAAPAATTDLHLSVVWLEEQGTGRYVRTLHRFGNRYNYNLETWAQASAMKVDATTEVTPDFFGTRNTGVVDISDIPDGTYEVHFEFAGCELGDEYASISTTWASTHAMLLTFDKDGTSDTANTAGAAPFTNVNLTYTASGGNRAPGVEAGADRRVWPTGTPEEATIALDGLVTDDGGTPTATWRLASANPAGGQAWFVDANDPTTEVSFSRSGIYVLELDAYDGNTTSTDDMTVYVNAQFLAATDDAEVNSSSANVNRAMGHYADTTSFLAQGYCWGTNAGCGNSNNCSRVYLQFDVSGVTGVEYAFLRIPFAGQEIGGGLCHHFHLVADAGDGWSDASLTWANQPISGGVNGGIPSAAEPWIGTYNHDASPGRTWFLVDLDLGEVFPSGSHSNNTVGVFARPCNTEGFGLTFRENHLDPELVVIEEWESTAGDRLTLSLAASRVTEGQVATVAATLAVNPTPVSTLIVDLTSDDSTVTVPPTATISGGSTQATFDLTIVDNSSDDGNRTVVITANDPGDTYFSATVVIQVVEDDTVVPQVSWDSVAQTVSEADVVATLRATLSYAPTAPVTVPYTVSGTATSGVDHDLSDGTLTFQITDVEESLVVSLTFDGQPEGNETVVVTLGSPTGAMLGFNPVHTLTITDPSSGADGGPADGRPHSQVSQGGCGCDGGGVGGAALFVLAWVCSRRRRKQ